MKESIMNFLILLLTLLLSYQTFGANLGHRLGSDVIKAYPENTIEVLRASIKAKIHLKKGFKYWEFDVNETKDGFLIVHHDRSIKCLGKLKNLTYSQIKEYKINGCCKIPLLSEVLEELNKTFKGKVIVETKRLLTDKGRQSLISIVNEYKRKGNLKLGYLSFPKHFKKSFPNKKKWCPKLGRVMQARRHSKDLCKGSK